MFININIQTYFLTGNVTAGYNDEFLFYNNGELIPDSYITEIQPSQPIGGGSGGAGPSVNINTGTDFNLQNISFKVVPEYGETSAIATEDIAIGDIIPLNGHISLYDVQELGQYYIGPAGIDGGGPAASLLFNYPEAYGGCMDSNAFSCFDASVVDLCSSCEADGTHDCGDLGWYDPIALFDPNLPDDETYPNPGAGIEGHPGSCKYPIYGCTDPVALNYGYDVDGNYQWADNVSQITLPGDNCIYYDPTSADEYSLSPGGITEPSIGNIDSLVYLTYDNSYPNSVLADRTFTITHTHSINTDDGFLLNDDLHLTGVISSDGDTTTFTFNVDIPPFPDSEGDAPNIIIDDQIVLTRDDNHTIGDDVPYLLSIHSEGGVSPIQVEIEETTDVYVNACLDTTALNYYCYGSSPNFEIDDNLCPGGQIPLTQVRNCAGESFGSSTDFSCCNYPTTFVTSDGGEVTGPIIFNIEDSAVDPTISFFIHDLNITDDTTMNNHLTGFEVLNASQEYSVVTPTPDLLFRGNNISELIFSVSVTPDDIGQDSQNRDITLTTVGDLAIPEITGVESYTFYSPQFQINVVEGNNPPVFTDIGGDSTNSYDVTINEDETATFDVYV